MENEVTTTQIRPSVSLGEWIITMIIMLIPVVNIIMLFIWAFSNSTNPSKANWAKASLIFIVVGMVLAILFGNFLTRMIYSCNPY